MSVSGGMAIGTAHVAGHDRGQTDKSQEDPKGERVYVHGVCQ